jgi:hypothetical protein
MHNTIKMAAKLSTHCPSQSEPVDSTSTLHVEPFGKGVSWGSRTNTLSLKYMKIRKDWLIEK